MHSFQDRINLGLWLIESGAGEVEYANGGWSDYWPGKMPAHLKFANDTDAAAYILARGGKINNNLGQYETEYTSTRD